MKLFRRRAKPKVTILDEDGLQQTAAAEHVVIRGARAGGGIDGGVGGGRTQRRIFMCGAVFVLAFAGLGGRLAEVSLAHGPLVRGGGLAPADIGPRPEIHDRNGKILATNIPVTGLEIAGGEIWDADETARKIGAIIPNADQAALRRDLAARRYVTLNVKLTPTQRQAIFELGLPGVRFVRRDRRYYPQGRIASHLIGHTEPGKGGVMGLERHLNEKMADEPAPLRSSIDLRAQQIVGLEVAAIVEKFKAKAGWAALMDVTSGEVIALASYPDFDPNKPGAAEPDWRRNRVTYDRYELGSAFKSFTAAAALEAGVASETTPYDARRPHRVADKTIRDFHPENRVLTLSEVIQHSSNIGAAKIASQLGVTRQQEYLQALGLFAPLPIELNERRAPQLPSQWGPVESATISYGHGISVTPLHLLAAFGAVVNGGRYYAPSFIAHEQAREGREVFSAETSHVMRRILRQVVTDGTASKAEAPGYFPIGKTATADKPMRGGYNRNTRIASFIGAFPGHAPRYALLVTLDEPKPIKGTHGYATAGWNAAPAFARLVERLAPVLSVMPVSEGDALVGFMSAMHSAVVKGDGDEGAAL